LENPAHANPKIIGRSKTKLLRSKITQKGAIKQQKKPSLEAEISSAYASIDIRYFREREYIDFNLDAILH
jgi:hypothetical protein